MWSAAAKINGGHYSSNEFISLALTSTFALDESELYNPLEQFRGQQQRGPKGRENHSLPEKKV